MVILYVVTNLNLSEGQARVYDFIDEWASEILNLTSKIASLQSFFPSEANSQKLRRFLQPPGNQQLSIICHEIQPLSWFIPLSFASNEEVICRKSASHLPQMRRSFDANEQVVCHFRGSVTSVHTLSFAANQPKT